MKKFIALTIVLNALVLAPSAFANDKDHPKTRAEAESQLKDADRQRADAKEEKRAAVKKFHAVRSEDKVLNRQVKGMNKSDKFADKMRAKAAALHEEALRATPAPIGATKKQAAAFDKLLKKVSGAVGDISSKLASDQKRDATYIDPSTKKVLVDVQTSLTGDQALLLAKKQGVPAQSVQVTTISN